MSLTNRLRDMERRISQLEARVGKGEQVQEALVDAVEAAAGEEEETSDVPTMTLDGEFVGGERDQSQPL